MFWLSLVLQNPLEVCGNAEEKLFIFGVQFQYCALSKPNGYTFNIKEK